MVLLAALFVGLAIATLIVATLPQPVSLGRRIAPYVQTHRRKSGLDPDVAVAVDAGFSANRGPIAAIGQSLIRGYNQLVGGIIDVGDDTELRLRLRRAGIVPPTPAAYRSQQFRHSLIAAAVAIALAVVLGRRSGQLRLSTVALFAAFGLLFGVVQFKLALERRAARRRRTMQLSLYTVTQVLAVLTRANRGPIGAVRHLVSRSQGPLIDELRTGLSWIERGSSAEQAFEQLGRDAPEPSTARLFRLIASATSSGGSMASSLRLQAEQLRKEHSEHLEQLATKKRSAMVVPSIVVMVPVLLLYALAPGPGVLFGGGGG
jgi:Flp pilus assembly protein TadB